MILTIKPPHRQRCPKDRNVRNSSLATAHSSSQVTNHYHWCLISTNLLI